MRRQLYPKKRTQPAAMLMMGLLAFGLVWLSFNLWSQATREDTAVRLAAAEQAELPPLAAFASTADVSPDASPSIRTIETIVKSGDTIGEKLKSLGVSTETVSSLLSDDEVKSMLTKIYPGQHLTLAFNEIDELISLEQVLSETQRLLVQKQGTDYASEIVEAPVETRIKYASGVIEDSLFMAGQKSGLNDNLILQLANIFGYDIDFALDLRPNDRFSLLYEERSIDGQAISPGKILAAEFVNQERTYQAVYFEDPNGTAGYYTPDGQALRKAFLRSPVKFNRISSHFNPNRKHPILHTVRAHRGVDYAAPAGTPVKASGDGKVVFVGRKNGYGNCVILQHGKQYTTLYAHLSRFATGLRSGRPVEQGQTIGYVGMTGLATAPHLHYEFRINGVHQNPLTIKLATAEPISYRYRSTYKTQAQALLKQMNYQSMVALKENNRSTSYE